MFFRSDLKWEVLEPLRDIGKTQGGAEPEGRSLTKIKGFIYSAVTLTFVCLFFRLENQEEIFFN